jgi:S1-C subfamily serine protease
VGTKPGGIGHPNGENWTYTKGIVSSVRPDYEWLTHRATVIQTQTPINPGNSGGPLLSDDGKIVGVNSFGDKGAEGLNFAIARKGDNLFFKK